MVVQTARDAAKVRFDERGLVTCVIQDARSGEVLTVAYMNEEALQLTLETREVHLYSRSRREIWHKGVTSGNVQRIRQIRYDCDGDALVALVDPAGPACHTGERSCFYRDLEGSAASGVDAPGVPGEPAQLPYEALAALERTLLSRQRDRPEGSYTVELLEDSRLAGGKVRLVDLARRLGLGAAHLGDPTRQAEPVDLADHGIAGHALADPGGDLAGGQALGPHPLQLLDAIVGPGHLVIRRRADRLFVHARIPSRSPESLRAPKRYT